MISLSITIDESSTIHIMECIAVILILLYAVHKWFSSFEQQAVRERNHNDPSQDASGQLPTTNSSRTHQQSPEKQAVIQLDHNDARQDVSRQFPIMNSCAQQQSLERQERDRTDTSQDASGQLPTMSSRSQQQSLEEQAVREKDHNDPSKDVSRQFPTTNSSHTHQQSAELRAFRESYGILQDVFLHLLDLDSFANKLYAQKLITQNRRTKVQSQYHTEQRKCTLLLDAIDNRIKYKSRWFHIFLELLSEDPAMEDVSKKMHVTYEKQVSLDAGPTKLPSLIHYTEPLTGDHFDTVCNRYRKAIMSSNTQVVDSLTEEIMNTGKSELKAFFLCYQALAKATVPYKLDEAERILMRSLELAEATESPNRQLLLGRAYRIRAGVPRRKKNYKQGLEITQKGQEALQHAEPSSETACLFMEEALLRQLSEKWAPERQEKIKTLLKLALKHAKYCKDHQRARYTVSLVYLRQALFYLDAFEDKKSASPLPENLCKAEESLKLVELNVVGGANVYEMEYYVAYSVLSTYRQNPTEALRYARKAEGLLRESGIADDSYLHVRARLEVLEERTAITKGRETQV